MGCMMYQFIITDASGIEHIFNSEKPINFSIANEFLGEINNRTFAKKITFKGIISGYS